MFDKDEKANYSPLSFYLSARALTSFFIGVSFCLVKSNASHAASQVTGQLRLQNNQMAEGIGGNTGNRYNGAFDVSYRRERNPDDWRSNFAFSGFYTDASEFLYSASEANTGKKLSKISFVAGRAVMPWSETDADWGLGAINNRKNFTFFRPGQEGLTGINVERKWNNNVRANFFGSYLYIPEMNPGVEANPDGTITTKNPWAVAPARSAMIEGKEVPIFYKVNYPNAQDVVFKYSGGINFGYYGKNFDTAAFVLRKPENGASIQADVGYEPYANRVYAVINPKFYYHTVYGGVLKWKERDWTLRTSAISIAPDATPQNGETAAQYLNIETQKTRQDYVELALAKSNDRYTIGGGYLVLTNDQPGKMKDKIKVPPRWERPVNVHLKARLTTRFTVSFDMKYDTANKDQLYQQELSYLFDQNLLLSAGANIIGTRSNETFWSDFKDNDSVFSSLSYVF